MSEKKKKDKRAYLNDFKLNDKNEYEYKGDIYTLDLNEEDKKKVFNQIILIYIILFLSVLSGGLLPFKGMMNTFYIIIPYVFEFILSLMLIPVIYKIVKYKELRTYEYNKSVERFKPYIGVLMVNCIISLIGTIIYIYLNGYDPILISLLFILGKIITIVSCRCLLKVGDKLVYKKV